MENQIFELAFNVVKIGIKKALEAKEKESISYLRGYVNYPQLTYKDNGFPRIFKSPYGNDKVVDYKKYFKVNSTFDKDKIDLTEIDEYTKLKELLLKCNEYKEVFGAPNGFESDLSIINMWIQSHVLDLVSRALHIFGEENILIESQFLKIYEPIKNRVIKPELRVDIYVPILFTKFEFEEYIISDNISIVRMDDILQKSRSEIVTYSESIHDEVLMSSTHALKLENYIFENKNIWLSYPIFNNLNNYPLDIINSFFNTLRINHNNLIGYAQIIACPVNWVEEYKADLMSLKGVTTRSYPIEFNNYFWNQSEFPIINEDDLESIKSLFQIVIEKKDKKIKLAYSRLENSFYRINEGDKVIDLVIGLESLLSDNEKGEITYKLSLRAAYLLQLSSIGESKQDIFNNMKSIYSYRSAIVHGENKLEKKRYIRNEEGNEKLVLEVASNYLKECIKVLLQNPEFLDAKIIDKELILK